MANLVDIVKERDFYNSDRDLLRKFYRGRLCDVQPIVFPQYEWLTAEKYEILKCFFAYVNLLKPAVNRLVSGVYGGCVKRVVHKGSPQKDKVDKFLRTENGYALKCRERFKSGVMHGTGINVYTVDNDQVGVWNPNPIHTEIVSNPNNVVDIEWIIEGRPELAKKRKGVAKTPLKTKMKSFRFVNKFGWGTADSRGNITDFVEHGLGIVPATISYGENNHLYDEDEGDSLVLSAVQYSLVVSRLLINQVALIMNYVRPQAVATGEIKNPDDENPFEGDNILEMDSGGDFMFVTPKTNFNDLTATIDSYKSNFCISEAIPLDALDPSNIPENQSATSARLRNQPLSVTIDRLTEEEAAVETKGLTIVGALYQFIETNKPVDYVDFASRFQCSVTIKPSGKPESFAEVATAWKLLYDMKAKTSEDVIREFNPELTEEEVQARVIDIKAAADEADQILSQGDPGNNTNTKPTGDLQAESDAA